MTRYDWGGNLVEVDKPATAKAYRTLPVWDCTCGHCRNFVEVAKWRELPEGLLAMLDKLSIPPEKATYVCEYEARDGRLFYEVSYRLAGRVVKALDRAAMMDWGELWCGEQTAPGTAKEFPQPRFDLTLFLWLPWVLDEPLTG